MGKNRNPIKCLIIALIKMYQSFVSPFLGKNCRFYPSCSCYAEDAIKEHGLIYGFYLIIKRLLCCHPWHTGGYDPVPKKRNK
jgi:hypothetical protein